VRAGDGKLAEALRVEDQAHPVGDVVGQSHEFPYSRSQASKPSMPSAAPRAASSGVYPPIPTIGWSHG
jgi:hypothetical protein